MTAELETARAVGRIEGKLDMVLAWMDRHDEAGDSREGRIRKLELADRRYGAIAAIVAAAVTTLAEAAARFWGLRA